MRRCVIGILAVLGCAAATAVVIMYVNTWFCRIRLQQEYMLRLQEQSVNLDDEHLERYRNLARWYNYSVKNGKRETDEPPLLFPVGGDIGWLTLPEEQILPIHQAGSGTSWGAIHDPASSFPLGGAAEHTVLCLGESAEQLKLGAVVQVTFLNENFLYRVEELCRGSTESSVRREGADLTLLVPQGDQMLQIRCKRTDRLPEPKENTAWNLPGIQPVMAAFASAAFPAAVWGLCESAARLAQLSEKQYKTDKKRRKNGKMTNKTGVSWK